MTMKKAKKETAKKHPLELISKELEEYGCTSPLNKMELRGSKVGVITASIAYQYAKENGLRYKLVDK